MAGNPGKNTEKIPEAVFSRKTKSRAVAPETLKRGKSRRASGNEETYRLIVEKASQGIFVAQDGKLQFVNAPLAKFSTYSEKELFSNPFVNFIHPDDREMVIGNYQRRLRGEKAPSGYAFRVIDKNGKIRWLEIRSIEITWKKRPATLNFISDITERMRSEEALRKSEDRFKRVAENAGEWIWEVDVNGLYTYSSPAVEKILGYRPEELVGKKSFFEMFSPEEEETLRKAAWEVFRNRKTIRHFINTNVHKEGYPVVLETNATPILDREGNLLGYQGVDTDITEQKQAEELYRTLTESSQVGIYIIQDGKFLFANARFREYFRDDSQWLFRDCFKTIVHPEDRDKVRENAINMLKGKSNSSYEFRVIDGNGEIRWLLEKVSSISYRGKRAVLGNALDITDRKKAEEAQSRSEESARRLAEESAVLAEIGRIISSTLNIEEVYQLFSEKVKSLIPYDMIAVNLVKKDGTLLVNRYVEGDSAPGRKSGDEFAMKGTLTEAVIQTRRGLIIDGQNESEIATEFPGLVPELRAGFRSFMSVPLLSRDQPVGGLHFRSKGCQTYSEKDLKLAESIAAQIAGTIASAELFAELKKTQLALKQSEEAAKKLAQENATMAEIARILYSDFDVQAFYDRFTEEVRKLIHFDRISIGMLNADQNTLTFSYVSGIQVSGRGKGDMIPINGTVAEAVIRNRSSLFITEKNVDDYLKRFPALGALVEAGLHSLIFVPLLAKDRLVGILHLMLVKGRSYTLSDLKLSEKLGTLVGGAIANGRLFAELQEAEKALRASEEKYRLLVQNANDAIFIIQDGVIKFSNRKTETLFGYSAAELAAIPFLNLILPDDRESAPFETAEGCGGGKYRKPRSFRIGNKEGKECWVELKTIDIEWEGKAATLNFAGDITEQKKLEAQFLQAQKMEAVGQLAGGVAHDFNNLLTVINTHSQLALQELKEWDPLREKFQAIETAGQRAANLTRQLLAFSRRQVVAMKVLSLNEIVRDLEKMLRRLIGENIILSTKLDQNLGRIKADPGQIEQVIFNLVVNARDAMPKGGRLDIATSNEILDDQYSRTHMGIIPGSYIMLSVSDTGFGIHPKIRERIFDPFFTTKEKGKGTGLGLSTVYGIVKQTGGDITVYSEPGRGTTFKIYLPQVDEPLDRASEEGSPGKTPSGHETILIVEDEEEVRKLAAEILAKRGYRVLVAPSGEDALLLCEKQNGPIHLLLSDVIMPEISGPEFARRLKILLPEMKSLFMSGFPDNALHQSGLLEQGVNFLQKPFSVEGLTKRVREVLDG